MLKTIIYFVYPYLRVVQINFVVVVLLYYDFCSSRTLEIIALDMKQDSHSNLHHHVMGSNNLICFVVFFRHSGFYRALLESKTHTPVLKILATKTHYLNIPRLQPTSCATLVGHLNNAFYISREKKPTRCCILEATTSCQQLIV